MTEENRPWMQTAFGSRVHIPREFETVDRTEFTIVDVAYGLANIMRWNGALRMRYSVAQHSTWVCEQVMEAQTQPNWDEALFALLRDGHEFIVGDKTSPLKQSMPPAVRGWYRDLTRKIDRAIFLNANLPSEMPETVKSAVSKVDYDSLCREAVLGLRGGPRSDLRIDLGMRRTLQSQASWEPLRELSIEQAAERFLELYAMIQDFRGSRGGLHAVS